MLSVEQIEEIKEQAYLGKPSTLPNICKVYPLTIGEIISIGSHQYNGWLGLVLLTEVDWSYGYSPEDLEWFIKDWRAFLNAAIPYFKFPRCSLEIDEETQTFKDPKMSQDEIHVLATYMKQEWLKRTIDSWENIKTQYDEKDFSQANLLKTFIQLKAQVIEEAKFLESVYYRSVNKKPFDFRKLSGSGRGRTSRGRQIK